VKECPKQLIELVPYGQKTVVRCSNKDKGKDVKLVCEVGCIGCRLCTKQCESGAITVEDNLAHIDYTLCEDCGKCAAKCPQKTIS
jgi:heterodisulfide reductase subunit A-like polyferredoxin